MGSISLNDIKRQRGRNAWRGKIASTRGIISDALDREYGKRGRRNSGVYQGTDPKGETEGQKKRRVGLNGVGFNRADHL